MLLNLYDESTLLIKTGQNQVATTMLSNESNVNTYSFKKTVVVFFKISVLVCSNWWKSLESSH